MGCGCSLFVNVLMCVYGSLCSLFTRIDVCIWHIDACLSWCINAGVKETDMDTHPMFPEIPDVTID